MPKKKPPQPPTDGDVTKELVYWLIHTKALATDEARTVLLVALATIHEYKPQYAVENVDKVRANLAETVVYRSIVPEPSDEEDEP